MIPGSAGVPTKRRRCPVCGYLQMVSIILNHDAVACRRCDAKIPAPGGRSLPQPKREKKK